jgi:hypothetical protein
VAMYPCLFALPPTQAALACGPLQVVIQRLEVEAELKRSHKTCNALQPPALDLSMTEKDLSGMDCPSMPKEFLCPISMRLMTDPVVTPAGITYDRHVQSMRWLTACSCC